MTHAHALSPDEVLEGLEASREGLSATEVERRLREHGENRLPEAPKRTFVARLFAQIKNPLVLTLLAAAIIAAVVGFAGGHEGSWLSRYGDAIAILLIVLLNALLGLYQEGRSEAALEALQAMAAPQARVRRGGPPETIEAQKVVPGDILVLEAGDAVVADARLVESVSLRVEEASFTGESLPSDKDATGQVARDAPLADRSTMVFAGTTVVSGKATAVVTGTGAQSELGRIGQMIGSADNPKTPLEERLDRFGRLILRICIALSAVLLAVGLWRGDRSLVFLLLEAVSLAVAAIPEGLPAITTITLALGMQRMARRGAIVRRMPAVETLGTATVIASDKTGTLTQNEMTVRALRAGGRSYEVTGSGYAPVGEIRGEEGTAASDDATLRALLETGALCNDARLEEREGAWTVAGDPTEGALLSLAQKGGVTRDALLEYCVVAREIPFDSDTKRMTVVTEDTGGEIVAHVKGSADVLLPRAVAVMEAGEARPITDEDRAAILRAAEAMSKEALRVLALCRRRLDRVDDEEPDRELCFLGLVGMMDPPREGVREAVESCRRAGIRAVMITGDHQLTAEAIAREIGLWQPGDQSVNGAELAAMSDAALLERVAAIRVFARTTAEQKLRIVRAYKERGEIVAMTGDGVNDAAALREAHIGVAMGKGGTDVARQAADMVLSDDNFATIVGAVQEGRAIYRNIQKFIYFLLSSNMGLVIAVFIVAFAGEWPPLLPLMILWINLVTNGAPALALGVDPPTAGLMDEPPRRTNETLMGIRDYLGVLFVGCIMGLAAVSVYALGPTDPAGLDRSRSIAFSVLALSPLLHALSCRSPTASIFQLRPLVSKALIAALVVSSLVHLSAVLVPGLQPVFRTHWLTSAEWLHLLLLASLVLPAVEIGKAVSRWRRRQLQAGRA